MLSINPTELLNPHNVQGGAFTTDKTGGVVNSGNTAFGATGGSAAALRGGGLYSIGSVGTGGSSVGSPSSTQTPLSSSHGIMRGGGGRRRKHRRTHSRKRSSKKYARKRSLKYRMKHRHSNRRSHSRLRSASSRKAQTGGYHQYMGNMPFSLGVRTPGFALSSNMSALATPTPFTPYSRCT